MNPAYLLTVFQFIPESKPDSFWVITAFNPDGITRDITKNNAADSKLHEELTKAGLAPFRIIGMSPDASHAEPGWGIATDEITALSLGVRFR